MSSSLISKIFVTTVKPACVMEIRFYLSVYRMVPHLTAVLGTMLPMLGMAKHDNMRWVITSGKLMQSEFTFTYSE